MTVIKPVEYRTQSIDSSFEAEQVQFKLWRNLSASEKELLLKRVTNRGAMLALAGIKGQFPTASKEIIRDYYTTNTISNSRADTNTDMTRFDVLPEQSAIILNYLFYQTKFAKRGVLRVGPVGLVANHILPDMSPTQANSRFGRYVS